MILTKATMERKEKENNNDAASLSEPRAARAATSPTRPPHAKPQLR